MQIQKDDRATPEATPSDREQYVQHNAVRCLL